MRLLVHSANLGSFDNPRMDEPQTMAHESFLFTDENFPPRYNAMTPRLQARICKMFAWQIKPDYDYYLWIDASCRLSRHDSLEWFFEKLEDADIAVFKHPNRNTVQEEADYLKYRLTIEPGKAPKDRYVTMRYKNEDIDGALKAVDPSAELFASTAYIYRNTPEVQEAMKEWWYLTSRFHSIDQLALPYAIKDLKVNVIPDKYMECDYVEYTRL